MHCRPLLLLLLCLSPVASLQLGGVLGHNVLLGATSATSRWSQAAAVSGRPALRSCMPPRMQQRWGPVDLTLSKPLGLVLEEFGGGGTAGVVVVSLVEGGAAEESGDVLPGDRLSRVDGADVSKLDFDAVMEALVAAPETLTLRLSRKLPARGDDNAPLDIVANLAKQLAKGPPSDAVKIDKVVRQARVVLRERLASESGLRSELGEFLRIETIVGAGVQRDGSVKVRFDGIFRRTPTLPLTLTPTLTLTKVRFFGIFSTDGASFSSYSCNISATGRVDEDGAVTIVTLECAKDEGWGRTIGVVRE